MPTTADYILRAETAMAQVAKGDWLDDVFLSHEPSIGNAEWHPLLPFLPADMRLLFLGSFPPQPKRWCVPFFYPNFTNDHWRIQGLVFHNDAQHFVDVGRKVFRLRNIVGHLCERGIGYFDTALVVRRLADNASDKFLEVVQPTDIAAIVAARPSLRAIATTGEKATTTICAALGITDSHGKPLLPAVGTYVNTPLRDITLWRLPSSSRAYPLSLPKKSEAYAKVFTMT